MTHGHIGEQHLGSLLCFETETKRDNAARNVSLGELAFSFRLLRTRESGRRESGRCAKLRKRQRRRCYRCACAQRGAIWRAGRALPEGCCARVLAKKGWRDGPADAAGEEFRF